MLGVLGRVIRVHEDVVEIDDNVDVEEVGEDAVNETLKGRRSAGQSPRDNPPLVRAIASAESGFWFITFGDPK
jgi:hypothetical protein